MEKCNVDYLTAVFKQLPVTVFTNFVKTVLEQFAENFMKMEKILALIGALTAFLVSEKILGMCGITFNRMKV